MAGACLRSPRPLSTILRSTVLLLTALTLPAVVPDQAASAQTARKGRPIVDDLVVRRSIALRPGIYRIRDVGHDGVIQIQADGVTLDGTGVTLIGEGFEGFGIVMNGHSDLTLKNFEIRGFDYGVRIENASGVVIRGSDVSGNRKDTSTGFLDIGRGEFYGGGILFKNVSNSVVAHNVLTDQSTGLEMIDSHDNLVLDNTTSSGPEGSESAQNSCWGVRLQGSERNLVRGTIADYVDRERYGHASGDSAGILLVSGSHDNRIISNSLTYSGDGFFIGNSCVRASNRNYVWGNDGSNSPHNAFECTFSDGNVFESNFANSSDYGFWLGYSYNTRVARNAIGDNLSVGVAIEQGQHNRIESNEIFRNSAGVRLWGPAVCSGTGNCGRPCPSSDYHVRGNAIALNPTGIYIEDTAPIEITRNAFGSNRRGFQAVPASAQIDFTHNGLACGNPLAVPENLALGKPASANEGGATAPRAVDGVVYDAASSWAPPRLGGGDWWQVDLQSEVTVAEVVIFPYFINLHDFPYQFHIDVSSTGAFAGEEIRLVTETARPRHPVLVYPFEPRQGRYLRLVSDESEDRSWIRMMELAVFSDAGHFPLPCQHSVYNGLTGDLPAPRNDWGTTDAADIAAVIYDQADDPAQGEVVFSPPLADPLIGLAVDRGPGVGAWSTTTALPVPSSAPFLDRGRQLVFHDRWVYLFGGRNADDRRLTGVYFSALRPDGTLGPWTETTALPRPFYDHVVVRVGQRLYLISGAAGDTAVYTAAIGADGAVGAWTATAPLLPSRQSFAAVSYGPWIYATGGNSGGIRDFVKRTRARDDGTLEPWTDLPPLPEPIQGHTMVAYGGFLYVLAPGGEVLFTAVAADGSLGAWTPAAPLPQPSSGHASFEHQGHLYSLGGTSAAIYHAAVLADGSLGGWQGTTALPVALRALRVGASGDYLYALGGFDGTAFRDTAHVARLDVPTGCDGGETVVAPLAAGPAGVASVLAYEGFATITVSGVGQASGESFSDDFYIFADGDGVPVEPRHPTATHNWVLTINGEHAEAFLVGSDIPAYRSDHRYAFSIVAPSGQLRRRRSFHRRQHRQLRRRTLRRYAERPAAALAGSFRQPGSKARTAQDCDGFGAAGRAQRHRGVRLGSRSAVTIRLP